MAPFQPDDSSVAVSQESKAAWFGLREHRREKGMQQSRLPINQPCKGKRSAQNMVAIAPLSSLPGMPFTVSLNCDGMKKCARSALFAGRPA